MSATWGRALTEAELRTYFKCSQLHAYGGTLLSDLNNQMVRHTVEYYLSHKLRHPDRDETFIFNKAIIEASRFLDLKNRYPSGQIQSLTNKTTLWLDEFKNLFSPNVYMPLTGPLPWRVKISKSTIDLEITGIFRTAKNATFHILVFSPYKDHQSQVNDPILHLKCKAMSEFVKQGPTRPQAIMHMLWMKSSGEMGIDNFSSSKMNPLYLQAIEQKIQQLERGEAFPVLPCLYDCSFKNKCFPGKKDSI